VDLINYKDTPHVAAGLPLKQNRCMFELDLYVFASKSKLGMAMKEFNKKNKRIRLDYKMMER